MWGTLRHLFLPHHTNNHRARVLHIDALFIYVILFVLVQFSFKWLHRAYPDVLGYAADIRVDALLSDTNARRAAHGLSTLTFNSELSQAAAAKANDMFANNYWAHVGPKGETPWDFIVNAGYKYTVAGENLAKNFSTSQAVVDAWMSSPSHRDNMLKSTYRDIGFAVVNGTLNGEQTTLVVQMFGATSGELAAVPLVTPAPTAPLVLPTITATQQTPASKPIVLPEYASMTQNASPQTQFLSSLRQPLIDISQVSRLLVFSFIGFMLTILAIDAWMAAHHKVVRVTGHNIAHILFLTALAVTVGIAIPGSIL